MLWISGVYGVSVAKASVKQTWVHHTSEGVFLTDTSLFMGAMTYVYQNKHHFPKFSRIFIFVCLFVCFCFLSLTDYVYSTDLRYPDCKTVR